MPRLDRAEVWIAAAVLLVVVLMATLLASVASVRESQGDVLAELRESQLDHRQANQGDHDCIVALAMLLADPSRDRTTEVVPPDICTRSAAAGHAEEAR